MRASTVRLTKQQIDKKTFHIVKEGLQVMPPAHYNAWQTVTEESAVMIDDNIYCTQSWYDDLMSRM
jgi:hypothetical protein